MNRFRTWFWRIVAFAGFAGAASSPLLHYYLYVVSPKESEGDNVVRREEHGQQFFVRVWENELPGMLGLAGVVTILLVFWIDWLDRKKHGRLKPYSPIPDWRGRPKADPRDIITYKFGYFVVPWIILVSAAAATGGEIPFGALRGG